MSESARLDEIRERVEKARAWPHKGHASYLRFYRSHVPYLLDALAASLAREWETAAVLPKAWAVLGLVDKLKQGDTFVVKELREALIALANQDGAAGRSDGGTGQA